MMAAPVASRSVGQPTVASSRPPRRIPAAVTALIFTTLAIIDLRSVVEGSGGSTGYWGAPPAPPSAARQARTLRFLFLPPRTLPAPAAITRTSSPRLCTAHPSGGARLRASWLTWRPLLSSSPVVAERQDASSSSSVSSSSSSFG